jgi:hypothetical protein
LRKFLLIPTNSRVVPTLSSTGKSLRKLPSFYKC